MRYTVSVIALILAAHIVGAIATGFAGAYALSVLYRKLSDAYRRASTVLGFLAAFEVCTGTALSVLSAKISASLVCERIVVYLTIVLVVEFMFFVRMRKISVPFPHRITQSIAASVAMLGFALALGF